MKAEKKPSDVLDLELTVGPERKRTSIWIDPLIWRGFKASCRKVGQSTCGVMEPFMYAFNRSVSSGEYQNPRPMIVNLHMERIVQRYRRKGHEIEVVEEQEVQGDLDHCAWCGKKPEAEAWIRHSPKKVKHPYLCVDCLRYIKSRQIFINWRRL